MKKLLVIISLVGMVCCMACKGWGSQGNGLLSSSGRSGEVLIVCSDNMWKSLLGDSLQAILMQPVVNLPQQEPLFTVTHVTQANFTKAYQKERNIIHFNIHPQNENKVSAKYDVWATPQLLITITAQSEQDAAEQLSLKQKEIIDLIMTCEWKRFQRSHKSRQNFQISNILKEKYHFNMVVPEGYSFSIKNEEFAWLRKETKDWGQSILIFVENYTDTSQFSTEHIIALRNAMTKKYVFGPTDSSYMTTEMNYLPPVSTFVTNEPYTIKTEGLWKLEGDFMGGPFVSYTLLDTRHNKIITIDGFLYAPSDTKRDLMRQVEAVIKTATFVQDE